MKHLKLLLYNLLVLLTFFLLLELLVRINIPEIQPLGTDISLFVENKYDNTFGLSPNAVAKSMGNIMRVDNLGFWSYNNNSSNKGWLLLGDSVTMGLGTDQDSTFAALLAFYQDSLKVLNLSALGYASKDCLNITQQLAPSAKLEIKKITLFWCLNDVYSNIDIQGPKSTRAFPSFINQFFYKYVYSYQWAKKIFFDRPKTYYLYDKPFYKVESNIYQNSLSNLKSIKSLSDSLNIEFEVVILPYKYQFETNNFDPQHLLGKDLRESNIQFYDIRFSQNLEQLDNFYNYGDGIHFSKEGHKQVFESLVNSEVF